MIKKNSYFTLSLHHKSKDHFHNHLKADYWKKRPTIFKGEAVHDGHPIEPVLVAGVSHREDAGAVTQQRALQPAGNGACNHSGFLSFQRAVCGEWIMPENRSYLWLRPSAPRGSPPRSRWSSWSCWWRGGSVRRRVCKYVTLQQSKALPLRLFLFLSSLSLPWGNHPSSTILLVRQMELASAKMSCFCLSTVVFFKSLHLNDQHPDNHLFLLGLLHLKC